MTNFAYNQVTDVINNLSSLGMSNLTYKDNFIYFNSYVEKKIYRFDYTTPNSSLELFYQFNENPNFLYVKNNYLFIGLENPSKTYRIDLSSENFQPLLVANIAGPMAQINNDLYIGQYVASKIVKINLLTNAQTDALVGYKPNFFTVDDNKLYFTSNFTNTLYKYDSTTGILDSVLNNLNYASGIVMNDELLFICESAANSISYYTKSNFQFQSLVQLSPNSWPNGIIIIGSEIFFIQTVAGKISKMPITPLLSNIDIVNLNPKVNIYPNPTTNFIKIESKYPIDKYKIFNLEGKIIQKAIISDNTIDVSHLSKGKYILMLDEHPFNFLKN